MISEGGYTKYLLKPGFLSYLDTTFCLANRDMVSLSHVNILLSSSDATVL